jgi:uncharacterized phiE125 gp8 family phage protein
MRPAGMFALATLTEPAEEPITLDEAKLHLRVGDDAEDDLIAGLVRAARRLTEKECNRRWLSQTLKLTLADWPCDGPWPGWRDAIALPVEPVASVDAVRYYALDGTLTTLSTSRYQVWLDHSPPLVAPAPYSWWPVLQPGKVPAVEVEFTAGADTAAEVPDDAAALVKLVVGYWYEHRGDGDDPAKLGLPPGAVRLVQALASTGYR